MGAPVVGTTATSSTSLSWRRSTSRTRSPRKQRATTTARVDFAGGFLDSHILPKGQFGTLFSAGAIPLISTLLGIKVGAELSVIIDRFRN